MSSHEPLSSQIAYLARALKTPTIAKVWDDLAHLARDSGWSHEEYLAAVLARQVTDREASGAAIRLGAAHFPAIKTLEDFTLDHQPSLRRDVLAHLATCAFIPTAENVIFLGPPGLDPDDLIGVGPLTRTRQAPPRLCAIDGGTRAVTSVGRPDGSNHHRGTFRIGHRGGRQARNSEAGRAVCRDV